MFTGLVEITAPLATEIIDGPGKKLGFDLAELRAPQGDVVSIEGVELGASVAINGCCLTVIDRQGSILFFEAGSETLSRTNLGALKVDDPVNIERSLRVGDRMGGHYVTGHVDGLGQIARIETEGEWRFYYFSTEFPLLQQMASKGSITIDGISLTLVEVTNEHFSVALIPHTLSVTTLGRREIGDHVNLETDVLAKYVQRQLEGNPASVNQEKS
jgi:riboflavin synthase